MSTTVDDPADIVGTELAIAIGADGLPVISHLDFNTQGLRVTHCGNATCSAGNVSTTVDDPADWVGADTSLAIGSDGLPVISHTNQDAHALRVTHCSNAACTTATSVDADRPAAAGDILDALSSLAIAHDGLPIVSHMATSGGIRGLRVLHCGNAACTAGNVAATVENATGTAGAFSSLAVATDGLPVISPVDTTASRLRVAKCGSRTCQ